MNKNELYNSRSRKQDYLLYCQKETPPSRLSIVKQYMTPFFVVLLFIIPFILAPTDEGSGGGFVSLLEPAHSSTIEDGVGKFISTELLRDFVQTDDGLVVALTTLFQGTRDYDIKLVKLAMNGTKSWTRSYGRTESDRVEALVHTSDGGLALASHYLSDDTYNIWLIKTDKDGNTEFNTTFRFDITEKS